MIGWIDNKWSPCIYSVIGLTCAIAGSLVVLLFGPSENDNRSNLWVYQVAAVLLFGYQTMDALDGLQSKIVDMYHSPMAELFDHGVDSLCVVFYSVVISRALGLGNSVWTTVSILSSFLTFFGPTWEHLHVGKMRFQSGAVNPTEALFLLQSLLLITSWNPEIWEVVILKDLPLKVMMVLLTFISSVISLGSSVAAVVREGKSRETAFKELGIFLAYVALVICTFGAPGPLFTLYPTLSTFLMGLFFAHFILHMIASEITKIPLQLWAVFPAIVPVVAMNIPFIGQGGLAPITAVVPAFVWIICVYLFWLGHIIQGFTRALGMDHWWSVPPFRSEE